jgi:hypothetical protein
MAQDFYSFSTTGSKLPKVNAINDTAAVAEPCSWTHSELCKPLTTH